MKSCNDCKESKPKSEFYRSKVSRDGFSARCKPCQGKRFREWASRNREHLKRRARIYDRKNRKRVRELRLARVHRVPLGTYKTMLKQQRGQCAICKIHCSRCRSGVLEIDHDHETNRVRGLLCPLCNKGLGHFRDSSSRLFAAIKYLANTRFSPEELAEIQRLKAENLLGRTSSRDRLSRKCADSAYLPSSGRGRRGWPA